MQQVLPKLDFHAESLVGFIQRSQAETSKSHPTANLWDSSNMENLTEIVRRQLAATGRNPFEAARRGGLERSFVNDILIGKKQSIASKNISKLAFALDVPTDELMRAMGMMPAEPDARLVAADPLRRDSMPLDIPVLGHAVGGSDGDFSLNGEILDYVRRPPGIASPTSAYALFLQNSSMSPRFEHGELIFVSKIKPPSIGDYVVLETNPEPDGSNGAGYVKRLKRRNAASIILEQFNPPLELTFDTANVKLMHRIFNNNELFGA